MEVMAHGTNSRNTQGYSRKMNVALNSGACVWQNALRIQDNRANNTGEYGTQHGSDKQRKTSGNLHDDAHTNFKQITRFLKS